MAKINPKQLFVDAFRKYNLERYKDSRVDKPRFQGLQLSEVTLGTITVVEETNVATIDLVSSESRRFNAAMQTFIKAHIGDAGISVINSAAYPYEDIVTMKALSEPGLVAYMNTKLDKVLTAVVFSESNPGELDDVLLEVQSILTVACNYTIDPTDISVTVTEDPKVWKVAINCETIYSDIIAVRSEIPVLDIPETDYGALAVPLVVPNPYPPVEDPGPQ